MRTDAEANARSSAAKSLAPAGAGLLVLGLALAVMDSSPPPGSVTQCGRNICNAQGEVLNRPIFTSGGDPHRAFNPLASPHARRAVYSMFYPSIDEAYLWAVDVDGTVNVKISRSMGGETEVQRSAAAPNGQLAAYAYGRTSYGRFDLDIVSTRGGAPRPVAFARTTTDRPEDLTWSCDSRWLKFRLESEWFFVGSGGGVALPLPESDWPWSACLFVDGFEAGTQGAWS